MILIKKSRFRGTFFVAIHREMQTFIPSFRDRHGIRTGQGAVYP
jgi:hypothetical protein